MSRYRKTMADAYAEVTEHKGTEPHEHPHEPTDPDIPESGTDPEFIIEDGMEELHKLISQGKSAEEIAKIMNLDMDTIRALMSNDVDEVAPPGWGHTKAEKEKTKPNKPKSKIGGTAHEFQKDLDSGKFKGLPGDKTYKDKKASMFKLMWSMKNKGDKPHYKPGVKDKLKKKYKGPEGQNEEKEEARLFTNVPNSVVKKANKEADKIKKQLEKKVLGKSTQNTTSGADITSKNDVYEGSVKAKKARKFKVTTPGQDRNYEKLSAERMFKAYEASFSVPNDAGGWPTGDTPPVPDEAYQQATTKNKIKTKKQFAQNWANAVAKKRVRKEEVEIQMREGKDDWDLIMKNARAYWTMKNAKHFVDNMPSLTSQQKKDAMKAAKKWLR